MTQLQKVENPIELNFEELGDAGISVDEINRSLANQLDSTTNCTLRMVVSPKIFCISKRL